MSLRDQILTLANSSYYDEVLTPRTLARTIDSDSVVIADELMSLVREGILSIHYRVSTPEGIMLNQEFTDPREIPDHIEFDNEVMSTANMDIIPVFKFKEQS